MGKATIHRASKANLGQLCLRVEAASLLRLPINPAIAAYSTSYRLTLGHSQALQACLLFDGVRRRLPAGRRKTGRRSYSAVQVARSAILHAAASWRGIVMLHRPVRQGTKVRYFCSTVVRFYSSVLTLKKRLLRSGAAHLSFFARSVWLMRVP